MDQDAGDSFSGDSSDSQIGGAAEIDQMNEHAMALAISEKRTEKNKESASGSNSRPRAANVFSFNPEVDGHNSTGMVSRYLPPSRINEDESEIKPVIFLGLTFGIFGFGDTEFQNMEKRVLEFGGIVNNNKKYLDYGIFPIYNVDISAKVGHRVTSFWLKSCVDYYCICDVEEHSFFSPICPFDVRQKPLIGCVISTTTNCSDGERKIIVQLAEHLGAKYQETLSRKTRVNENLLANTHLISNECKGKQYEDAKLWKILVVTHEWLICCVEMGRKVEEVLFLPGSSKVSGLTRPSLTSTPKATLDNKCLESQGLSGFGLNTSASDCQFAPGKSILRYPKGPNSMQSLTRDVSTISLKDFQTKDKSLKVNKQVTVDDQEVYILKPKFKVEGMIMQEKEEFKKLVIKLGGDISLDEAFSQDATHLIVELPRYTEQYLASVAKGLWVLKKTYLKACERYNRFVNEEDYEWGAVDDFDSGSKEDRLAKAAKHWRVKINEMKRNNVANCGAFSDWKVLILTESERTGSFVSILSAGGAEIVAARPPFADSDLKDVTHAFIKFTEVPKPNVKLASLHKRKIIIVRFEHIVSFLVGEENMYNYLINYLPKK